MSISSNSQLFLLKHKLLAPTTEQTLRDQRSYKSYACPLEKHLHHCTSQYSNLICFFRSTALFHTPNIGIYDPWTKNSPTPPLQKCVFDKRHHLRGNAPVIFVFNVLVDIGVEVSQLVPVFRELEVPITKHVVREQVRTRGEK